MSDSMTWWRCFAKCLPICSMTPWVDFYSLLSVRNNLYLMSMHTEFYTFITSDSVQDSCCINVIEKQTDYKSLGFGDVILKVSCNWKIFIIVLSLIYLLWKTLKIDANYHKPYLLILYSLMSWHSTLSRCAMVMFLSDPKSCLLALINHTFLNLLTFS